MTDNVSAAQLEQFIERIERLTEDKKAISDDIKDTFSSAKSDGFDTKTMKTMIKLRAMDRAARQEQDALEETYRTALNITD